MIMPAFPGCGAVQKRVYARERAIAGAPLIRGLRKLGGWDTELATIPGLQRTTYVLRCAREKWLRVADHAALTRSARISNYRPAAL
jgi:hypothetical protein